jgi:hypothetical protein
MGKPVTSSTTPLRRNPEREPSAKAGSRVVGSLSTGQRKGCGRVWDADLKLDIGFLGLAAVASLSKVHCVEAYKYRSVLLEIGKPI